MRVRVGGMRVAVGVGGGRVAVGVGGMRVAVGVGGSGVDVGDAVEVGGNGVRVGDGNAVGVGIGELVAASAARKSSVGVVVAAAVWLSRDEARCVGTEDANTP